MPEWALRFENFSALHLATVLFFAAVWLALVAVGRRVAGSALEARWRAWLCASMALAWFVANGGQLLPSVYVASESLPLQICDIAGILAPLAPYVMKAFPGPDKDPITALRSVHVPLIFVHGTRDAVIAHDHSAQLYAAANSPKELWTVEDAEHVAVFGDAGPWRDRLTRALEAAVR